jgi:hypothetical protein
MHHSFINLTSPILAFMFYALIQVCGVRWIKKLGLFNSMVFGTSIGLVVLILLEFYWFWLPSGTNLGFYPKLISNLIIYLCLSYNYFHFINMGETARRIRIIREIYDSPNGLSEKELLKCYNSEQMIDLRMERLLSKNQVILEEGRYFIGNPTMLAIANMIVRLKIFFLGKRSEFE